MEVEYAEPQMMEPQAIALAVSQHEDLDIESIIIGDRYRKELGDIERLAESISEIGLLQPIVVSNENELVAGERRIRAFQHLGWSRIPVRRVNIASKVRGEFDENEVRENFRPSEQVAIAQAVAKDLGERRGRPGEDIPENFPELKGAETRDIAAKAAGFGNGKTYEQAKAVVESNDEELIDAMDSGKVSISAAAQLVKQPAEIRKEVIQSADPKKAMREAVIAAATAPPKTSTTDNRNPLYRPNDKFKAVASVTGFCDSINTKIETLGVQFLNAGILDDGMRSRETATIKRCIENLNQLMEAMNA